MALARRHELSPLTEPEYELEDVPRASSSGDGSATKRITDRNEWIGNLAEMILLTNRAGDDHERKAVAAKELVLHPGKPLSLEYMADRLDTDDPLWGWTIRTTEEGWLQGYISVTTFTTWQRWFRWDTLCEASGVLSIDRAILDASSPEEERKTQEWWDARVVDGDGRLAMALNRQIRDGDWTDEGVVWPRIAEISLLGGLGCGGLLLDGVIEELSSIPPGSKERQYDYIVCQATENAVPFYESRGFVRVGAIARYEQKLREDEEVLKSSADGAAEEDEEVIAPQPRRGRGRPPKNPRKLEEQLSSSSSTAAPPTAPTKHLKASTAGGVDDAVSLTLEPGVVLTGTSSPCDWIGSSPGDTPAKIAKRLHGVRTADIVFLNRRMYPDLGDHSLLIPGTRIRIPKIHPYDLKRDGESVIPFRITSGQAKDIFFNDSKPGRMSSNGHWYSSNPSESIRKIATRFNVNPEALAAFNKARYGALVGTSALQEGTILWIPQKPVDLRRVYALGSNYVSPASTPGPVHGIANNGKQAPAATAPNNNNNAGWARGRPRKKPKVDDAPSCVDEDDPEVAKWFTEDEAERNARKDEMEMHIQEVSDPKLIEFYSTEKCDDISIIEGRQTKRLSEVMAYRHWTFPDDPAALTVPSYMMVLPLNDAYLEEHVPSLRKKKSSLELLKQMQERKYPVPPFNYRIPGEDAEVVPPPSAEEAAVDVPAAAMENGIAHADNPPPSEQQTTTGTGCAPATDVSVSIKVSVRCDALKSWRHGPVDGPEDQKIFFKGCARSLPVQAILPNGPLRPRPPQPPKRPTTSFLEFCQHERPVVIESHPNMIPRDITVLLAEAWKSLASEDKIKYEKISDANRERYHAAMDMYRKELAEYHSTYGLDADSYDLDHPEGPRLRKVRLSEMPVRAQLALGDGGDEYNAQGDERTHGRIQHMVSDRMLGPNQPKLFNKVVVVRPKESAKYRMEWLKKQGKLLPAVVLSPPALATMTTTTSTVLAYASSEASSESSMDEPPPPPPYSELMMGGIPVTFQPPPAAPAHQHDDPQYYFTLTYIPDVQWCRLAPLQEAGTFQAGMSKKKGYERHVGRTRWVLAPEHIGREIDVSATRCVPVSRAIPVKNNSDADKEEWDILDDVQSNGRKM